MSNRDGEHCATTALPRDGAGWTREFAVRILKDRGTKIVRVPDADKAWEWIA
jgi:hypothetical protein